MNRNWNARVSDFTRAFSGGLRSILRENPGVRAISIACVAVFVVQLVLDRVALSRNMSLGNVFEISFGIYWPVAKLGAIWQFVTYAFLHGSFWHLLMNLFTLVFLGYAVERIVGTARFWGIFLASSALGGLCWMLFDAAEPSLWQAVSRLGSVGLSLAQRWGETQSGYFDHNVCVGASGGVFGLMGAFVALCPRERLTLLLFYVVPVTLQARSVALLLVAFNVFGLVTSFGHVAHVAHLAGGVAGYLYARRLVLVQSRWGR